jgi:hypothetical protein
MGNGYSGGRSWVSGGDKEMLQFVEESRNEWFVSGIGAVT